MQSQFYQQLLSLTKLSKGQVDEFLSKGTALSIPAKTLLIRPGQPVKNAYFLKQGIIRHFIKAKSNKEFTKNFIRGPRFMLPSLSDFFLQTPSSIYCQALTTLEVIRWDYDTIINFGDTHPIFYKFLLTGTVQAFRGKEQKEIALNQMEAKERYLQFLEQHSDIANEVSLQYIASYLNIRPETLSRIRASLIS